MKSLPEIDELATKYTTEIVVAQLANSPTTVDEEYGKYVANFYKEIFKGVSETLKNSSIKDYN